MKITLITGATSGIGREFARALAGSGEEELWLIGRRADRLAELSDELGARTRVRGFPLDLTDPATYPLLRDELRAAEADILWLVAAAGMGKNGDFLARTEQDARATVDLNCTALTSCLYTALPHMGRGSHAIVMASAAAYCPQPHFAVYAATKAYVLSLSRALGSEMRASGVRFTAVCPGPVDTAFLTAAAEGGYAPPAAKKKLAISPERVVAVALKAARRGRAVVTPGGKMKLCRLAAKILPHAWVMKVFR